MRALFFLLVPIALHAQVRPSTMVANPEFDKTIRDYLDFSVPVISCSDLLEMQEEVLILDARERAEYEVSHIPGARFVGYKSFDETSLQDIPKDKKIVVYCSIGVRSEQIAHRIQAMGYDATNLYGSIFEWVNQGYPIVDKHEQSTKQIHTFNRKWSRWVEAKAVEKTW